MAKINATIEIRDTARVADFIKAVAEADLAVQDKTIDENQGYYRIIGAFYQLLGVMDQDGGGSSTGSTSSTRRE